MRKFSTIRSIVLASVLLCFLGGVVHLFILRFETGDVYPAYSSLRSDPLGARALYDSLKTFDNIDVQRNYQFLRSVKFEPDTTFFYLGVSGVDNDSVPQELVEVFDRLTQSGGRLVLSFLPVLKNAAKKAKKTLPEKESKSEKAGNPGSPERLQKNKLVSIKKHWGIGLAFNANLPTEDDKYLAIDADSNRPGLPPAISWHTNRYFELFDNTWQVIYTCKGRPVMVERPFGMGTLVLSADSFFISNEALRSERHPQLLIWLMGRNSKLIFDKAHFGIYKQPGVAAFLRHYRFHWFFAALAVVALLFVWKNAAYFVPPVKAEVPTGADVLSEKDYFQGLIALLRSNISGRKILQICGKEWEQTFKKDKRIRTDTFERIKSILQTESVSSKKKTDPVDKYQTISRIISEDKRYE